MRRTKRKLGSFTFYDRTGIESFVEREAEKGWFLEKITSVWWVFARREPKKIHCAVTYFPRASAFDPGPSEEERRFHDLCAHAGWRLAASSAKLQVFVNEGADPVPVETDPAVELDSIHRSAKKSYLPSYYLMVGCGVLQLALLGWRLWEDFVGTLAGSFNLFSAAGWAVVIALSLMEVIGYYRWRKRALQVAEEGEFLPTRGHRSLQLAAAGIMVAAFVWMLASLSDAALVWAGVLGAGTVFAVLAAVLGLSALLKRYKVPAELNRAVTVAVTLLLSFAVSGALIAAIARGIVKITPDDGAVAYQVENMTFTQYLDELPLEVGHLREADRADYSSRLTESVSPLVAQYTAYQRPRLDALELDGLGYTVAEVRLSILYDLCVEAMKREYEDRYSLDVEGGRVPDRLLPIDAAPWGADAAYQLHRGGEARSTYLLCYEGRIVSLELEWEPTAADMAAVGEKLGLGPL